MVRLSFVQRPADDAAGETGLGEACHVGRGRDAAGGDHRNADGLLHLAHRRDVRAGEHAVGGDVGVDDRGDRLGVELFRQLDRRGVARLQPAVGGDAAVAGVDAEDQPVGKAAAQLPKPVGLAEGLGADHQPRQAELEERGDRLFVANAAAQLAGDADGLEDRSNAFQVGRPAGLGAVEIDQVQALGALVNPLAGHGRRVVAKDRFAAVVALLQADALAAAKINGRPDLHRDGTPPAGCTEKNGKGQYGIGAEAMQPAQ